MDALLLNKSPLLRSLALVAILPVFLGRTAANADAFTIDEWFLDTGVMNFATGSDSHAFIVVQNPFEANDPIFFGSSSSISSYRFMWAGQLGHFLIESSQQAEGVPTSELRTGSSGSIRITPDYDLVLIVDSSWTFDLPAWQMESRLGVFVYGATSGIHLLWEDAWGQPDWPGGLSGTVSIATDEPIALPAGETWILSYVMSLRTEQGTQGLMATGSGYVDFQISPEPATALPLALVLFVVSHRCPPRIRAARKHS
jgi:hypothetical protein